MREHSNAKESWCRRIVWQVYGHVNCKSPNVANKKANIVIFPNMDEGRKRVLGIIAAILVARHLKTTEDLFDTRDSPRTRRMVIAAVPWAKRIMSKIDEECGK
jgi:hypothetical protein